MDAKLESDSLEEQISLLEDPNPRVRIRAAGQLGQIGSSRAIEPLNRRMKTEEDNAIRARIIGALGQIGGAEVVSALCEGLVDPYSEVRKRAAEALNRINEPSSRKPLIKALEDTDRDVRRWAARALGRIGGKESLEALKLLRTDSDQVVQEEVIQAVDAIENRRKLSNLRKQVDQLKEARDQEEALDSLAQVQINGKIDMQQFELFTLQANLAGNEIELPSPDGALEHDRERQTFVNRLERLVRTIESLSESLNDQPYLKRAWEQQLREVLSILEDWKSNAADHISEEMGKELKALLLRKEELIANQKKDKVQCNLNFEQAYSTILEMEQIHDLLSDPIHRTKVETWQVEARSTYEQMDYDKGQGNYSAAKEQFIKITKLRDSAETVRVKDARQKQIAGYGVIIFVILGISILVFVLARMNGDNRPTDDMIDFLNVPYTVIIWSALGALTAMLFQFINRPVSQLDTIKWLFARPIQGIIMGSFLYLAVAGGFILLGNPQVTGGGTSGDALNVGNALRTEIASVIAFLGGFSDKFAEEMVRRATSILTQGSKEKGSDDDA